MKYSIVFIFKKDLSKILLIHKTKGPYLNALNGIGGKIDISDKNEESGAYREVMEETGLSKNDVLPLQYMMTVSYPSGAELFIYCTALKNDSIEPLQMEEEKLEWFSPEMLTDVRDTGLAGEGILPYFVNYALILEKQRQLTK